MKGIFLFAPDTHVTEHEIRFGTNDAEWTTNLSWVEGTFTQPMDIGNGEFIPPNGKKFRIPLVTLGHWGKDRLMHEEYLIDDTATFADQLGLSN